MRNEFVAYRGWGLLLALLCTAALTAVTARADDWTEHDRFYGQIAMSYAKDSFQDRVDGYSGNLHINVVELTLPGHGGLDLVVQRYYSSNIWNRAEGGVYSKLVAAADPMDHLGGSGWQLHMGKVIVPVSGSSDPWVAVMPDGSTHPLYNSYIGTGRISRERWTFVWNTSTLRYDLTLTDGTVYTFDPNYAYTDYFNRTVYQCTNISKPGVTSSSIQINYNPNSLLLTSISDTYNRTVTFQYVTGQTMLYRMNTSTGQQWTFDYTQSPQDTFYGPPPLSRVRSVYALTSVQPPAGSAWSHSYYSNTTPIGSGRDCLQTVTLPAGGAITYTYSAVPFDTGTQSCTISFCVIAGRQVMDRGASLIGTWLYGYTADPVNGTATTTVTVKDPSNTTLRTDVSQFNSWKSPYSLNDDTMWKVGLPTQRTVTTLGVAPNQVEAETYAWPQTAPADMMLSQDYNRTSNWLACGSYRQMYGIYFAEPVSVATSITRDGVTYTTTKSNYDSFGNPQTISEKVDTNTKRTAGLTYWYKRDAQNNPLWGGYLQSRDPSPGQKECSFFDTYGRPIRKILNPLSLSSCTGNSSSLETDYAYSGTTGDLTQETKVGHDGLDVQTSYLNYDYGQPRQIQIPNTNVLFDRTINPSGTIADATDGRGTSYTYRTEYSYDLLNRLTSIQPPVSGSLPTIFAYASDWSTVTVSRGGHSIVYSFDGLGRLVSKADQQTTHWVAYAYNALGVKTEQRLLYGGNAVDTYQYDALGRPTSVLHGGDQSSATYSYSAATGTGPRVTVTDEDGRQTVESYEAFGDPADTRLIRVNDAGGYQTSYQYNGYNLLTGITAPLEKGNRSFTYYPNLLLNTETGQEGGTTTYSYWGIGALRQKSKAGGASEYLAYDLAGRLTQRSFSDSTPLVTFAWDGAGQRTQMSSASVTVDYAYDGDRNLTSKQTSLTGVGNALETWTYDSMDRVSTDTHPDTLQVRYDYDDRDWVTAVHGSNGDLDYATNISRHVTGAIDDITFGNGARTIYGFDPRHRVNAITTTASGGNALGLTFSYDSVNNLMTWTDALNALNNRTLSYDALHRLTGASATNLWGNLTFGYDALGNRTSRTQASGSGSLTTSYTIDSITNRLNSATTGSLSESYTYDPRGNLRQAIIPQPGVTYSSANALQVQPGGGSTTVTTPIYGYGFLPSSYATFKGVPRPTTFVSTSALQVQLTYDDIKTAGIYPIAVANPDSPARYGAQAPGTTAPFVVYFSDVPPSHWAYQSVNLIAYNGITNGCGGGTYCPDRNLLRSEMAILLLRAKHGSSYSPPVCTGVFTDVACPSAFAVDWIEQLYHEGITNGCSASPLKYCPDRNTSKQEMAVFLLRTKESPSYVPPACVPGVPFSDVTCTQLYDPFIEEIARRGIDTGCGGGLYCPLSPVSRGLMAQMISRTWSYQMPYLSTPGNDVYTYTFDAADQLTTVQGPGGTVSYTYDGDGLRFSKSGPSGTVYYVRDGKGQVMAEYSGVPALLAEYIYLDGQRLCKGVPNGNNGEYRFYYHPDVLGTPLLETDDARHVVGRTEYYPFGEEVRPGSASDPHKFTGKELDSESGLYYFGARYYDAHLGRFISVDPAAGKSTDPQSWNRYAYALNNPLRFLDPDGKLTIIVPGTWAKDAAWAQPGASFNTAVGRTFGDSPVVLPWSHGNSEAARSEGARNLRAMVRSHTFAPGEKLNIVAHSHGGNLVFEAMANGSLGRRVDALVTLGTPVRGDYGMVHSPRTLGIDLNVYSPDDTVQTKGGESVWGLIEAGAALRTRAGAQNVEVPGASHSDLHSADVWRKFVEPQINAGKLSQ